MTVNKHTVSQGANMMTITELFAEYKLEGLLSLDHLFNPLLKLYVYIDILLACLMMLSFGSPIQMIHINSIQR